MSEPSHITVKMVECEPGHRFFYRLEVHPTSESMHQEIARLFGRPLRPGREEVEAACLRFRYKMPRGIDRKTLPLEPIGLLLFVHNQTPLHAVVHELQHAAIGFARRAGFNPMKPNPKNYLRCPEERLARCIQHMLKQIDFVQP